MRKMLADIHVDTSQMHDAGKDPKIAALLDYLDERGVARTSQSFKAARTHGGWLADVRVVDDIERLLADHTRKNGSASAV